MQRIVSITFISFLCTAAMAQSEEQTVAFIIGGIEAGKVDANPCDEPLAPEVVAASPARYRFRCKSGDIFDIVIRKAGACRYQYQGLVNGKEDAKHGKAVFDFNKFQTLLPPDATYTSSHFFLAGPGFCEPESTCLAFFLSVDKGTCCAFRAENTPFQRREKAINHLFKTFCVKGAF